MTEDHYGDDCAPDGTPDNAVGLTGPVDMDPDTLAELELYEAGLLPIPHHGEEFCVYNADRELVYEGIFVGHQVSGIEVLKDLNAIDPSAVEIAFLSGLTGTWELMRLKSPENH